MDRVANWPWQRGVKKDIALYRTQYFSRIIAATVVAGLVAAPTSFAQPRGETPGPHASQAKKRPQAAERKRVRRALQRKMRRNPRAVLEPGFMKKAAIVDFKLPLTVRLNRVTASGTEPSDDELEITYDDAVVPWPLNPDGVPPAPQITNLDGSLTMESSFADADGYGELGAMETVIGRGVAITATPFRISDFAVPCPDPQLETTSPVTLSSGGARYGLMNLFSGELRGTFALRMAFAGQRRATCVDPPTPTDTVDNSIATPMPVRFSGSVRVSPAITVDGRMRIGVLEVDDAVTPQISTFAYVRACTDSPCNAMQFPARLKLKKLRAELLIGGG